MNGLEASYLNDFEKIRQFIEQAKNEAASQVNGAVISYIGISGNLFQKRRKKKAGGAPR